MNDSQYGHYRQGKPFSSNIKSVAAGSNTPQRVRKQRTNFDPQPLGNIKRGDRSQTLWSKSKGNVGSVQPDNYYPADEPQADESHNVIK